MMYKILAISIFIVLLAVGPAQLLGQEAGPDVQAKIEDAMGAAPTFIAEDATILDWAFDEDGNFVVLREGTNGWTCLPGNPPDAAMCLDEVFVEWLYALITGEDLMVTTPGLTYMLKGGATLSNADPGATEPAEDQWMSSSPYMMVLLPAEVDLSGFSTDPNDPLFVMYGDTPYQHLMVPLGGMVDQQEAPSDVQAKIEDAMGAAPTFIAEDATILDWAFNEDGNLVVLREGTNGWTCLPGNPPDAAMCLDEVFMEWLYALITGEDLTVTTPGFTYMLKGGATLSNADPGATEPAEDQWVSSSPYMMILLPADVDLSGFSTDPNDPLFVMYGDTPYQHLMVPLGEVVDQQDTASVPMAPRDIERIEVADAYAMVQEGSAILVDVRASAAYELNHIIGALSIPETDLADRMGEIPRDQLIITYCD